MVEEVYPVLVVPEEIRALGPDKDQTPDQARIVFDWTMSILSGRIDGLLKFFRLEYPRIGSEYSYLLDLGARVTDELRRELNFRLTDNGAEPTAPSLSMGYDLGLFVGELVIRASGGVARWMLQLEGPRNRVDYNKAVLSGKPERLRIEPVRSSIADVRLIVQRVNFQMMWAWRYAFWLAKLTSDVWLRPEATLSRANSMGFPLESYLDISRREWTKARNAGGPYLRRPTSPLST